MDDLFIIDNCVDKREFRNYIINLLEISGFTNIDIEDVTLSDEDPSNDNDLIAEKGFVRYTIQTYLNEDITISEIDDAVIDMRKEGVYHALVIANREVDDELKKYAMDNNVEIWDRQALIEKIDLYSKTKS